MSDSVRLLAGGSPWRASARLDISGRSEGAVVRANCRGVTRALGGLPLLLSGLKLLHRRYILFSKAQEWILDKGLSEGTGRERT